jgi:hypothetical protein
MTETTPEIVVAMPHPFTLFQEKEGKLEQVRLIKPNGDIRLVSSFNKECNENYETEENKIDVEFHVPLDKIQTSLDLSKVEILITGMLVGEIFFKNPELFPNIKLVFGPSTDQFGVRNSSPQGKEPSFNRKNGSIVGTTGITIYRGKADYKKYLEKVAKEYDL